ncbi:hypothetical protein QJS04_geneDACA019455 [Acorus gramineus]|uniref:Uncharacterized protein n=1 Tax=Acorus gramineus TaxID=55184 RepID=A0AAV9AAJ0_ACOGR|nr:hypothetical protein QJS04_geneDACA019455 [Acorus gramineus]
MDRNMRALTIGVIGAGITLTAYSQTFFTSTQCVTIGFLVLVLGLLVKEGLIDV